MASGAERYLEVGLHLRRSIDDLNEPLDSEVQTFRIWNLESRT